MWMMMTSLKLLKVLQPSFYMYEIISDVETKIKIIQFYSNFLLKLYDFFGDETVVVIFLTMLDMFLFTFSNIYVLIFFGLFANNNLLTFKPAIEHISYTSPLVLKREYTVLTYVFGITYLRDIMDMLLTSCVRLFLKFCFLGGIQLYKRLDRMYSNVRT